MKKLLIILLLSGSIVSAQEWPVKTFVTNKKASNVAFRHLPSFTRTATATISQRGVYEVLLLDASFQKTIQAEQPDALKISVPISPTETITCELVKFSIGNIKITANNDDVTLEKIVTPLSYRGIVVNENRKHTVVLSVNKSYVSFFAALPDKLIQLTKADETAPLTYRLYNSARLQFPVQKFDCGTNKTPKPVNGKMPDGTMQARTSAVTDKCVNVFVECFDSLYRWQGSSTQQTTNYVYELFGLVTTGFVNDSINLLVNGINIWTTADPYRGDNRDNALADLANYYKDNFWGNICVGLDHSTNAPGSRSGLAGDIGRVKGMAPGNCPAYTAADHPFCYNDMDYGVTVQNFPTGPNTTQPQVYLVMHEMGHLLGSPHTKWCGWKLSSNPDTFGALDSCDTMEGSCMPGPPPPLTGATMMSYCVGGNTPNDFVNYNNGFGPLPGTAIRNYVSNNTCIPTCMQCIGSLHRHDKDVAFKKEEGLRLSKPRKRTLSP